jgi:hypothetical protein
VSHPSAAQIWQAIEIYLAIAYEGQEAPAAVRGRLETLRATPPELLQNSEVFERDGESGRRCRLRLGNRFYPHMKLVIDRSPDGEHWFLRADTHDQHIRPAADSPARAGHPAPKAALPGRP